MLMFRDLWHAITRFSDMTLLWPNCARHGEPGRQAFLWHIRNEPAWTDHYGDAALIDFVDQL
jgi:hypothetical protein